MPMAGSYNVNLDWQRTLQDEDLKRQLKLQQQILAH